MKNFNEQEQLKIAKAFCTFIKSNYVCHEYYYYFNGKWNWLHIVVDDYGGRSEIKVDLNAEYNKKYLEGIRNE